MVHPDGTEKTAFGINVGVIGFGWVFMSSVFTLARAGRQRGDVKSQKYSA